MFAFKVWKRGDFYEGFHLMKFQKVGTKSLISDFSELPVKKLFSNISWTTWPKELMEPILDRKFKAP